jgi:hypothetical protein
MASYDDSRLRSCLARFAWAAAAIAPLLAAACGCGDNRHAGKYEVSGAVSWEGTPIEKGFITYEPADGKPAEAGAIADGHYSFFAYPGKNRVAIRAEKIEGFNKGMNQPNVVQYIPAAYNVQSELSVEVTADGANMFNFSLPLTEEAQ